MAKGKYVGVDTVLSERPFSQISQFLDFEEADRRDERSEFAFKIISSIDDGVNYPFERTTEDLDALLIETLGSNLDELYEEVHLPALSYYSLADH